MTQPPAQSAFSQDWWRVTLDSIADAVIATDREGRVVFLNPVAQTLTGWTIVEAAGRRLEEVFVVVNETSRAKVENPVEKVFHTGHVAGLANHTVRWGCSGLSRHYGATSNGIDAIAFGRDRRIVG